MKYNEKIQVCIINKLPISDAEEIAQKISKEINFHVSSGIMLKKSPQDIMSSNSPTIFIDPDTSDFLGFYEVRLHTFNNQSFWEMGSVISKRKDFFKTHLLPSFNRQKNKNNIAESFLVTKDIKTAKKFKDITGGKILDFPEEFNRVKDDRFFILW